MGFGVMATGMFYHSCITFVRAFLGSETLGLGKK